MDISTKAREVSEEVSEGFGNIQLHKIKICQLDYGIWVMKNVFFK